MKIMTTKPTTTIVHDRFNNELVVGDFVLAAITSSLKICKIMAMTEKKIRIIDVAITPGTVKSLQYGKHWSKNPDQSPDGSVLRVPNNVVKVDDHNMLLWTLKQ